MCATIPVLVIIREMFLFHMQCQRIALFKPVDVISALTIALSFQMLTVCSIEEIHTNLNEIFSCCDFVNI